MFIMKKKANYQRQEADLNIFYSEGVDVSALKHSKFEYKFILFL